MSPARTVSSAFRSAPPSPTPPPRRALPRPDQPVVCPGFGIYKFVECKRWPSLKRGGAGQIRADAAGLDQARRGRARLGGTRRDEGGAPRVWPLVLDFRNGKYPLYICCVKKNPSHALHEKGLQRQKGDGPQVSSQERRAAVVPRINRLSSAGQARILFLHRFPWDFSFSFF